MYSVNHRLPNGIKKFKEDWGIDVDVYKDRAGYYYVYDGAMQIAKGESSSYAFAAARTAMKRAVDERAARKCGDALQRLITTGGGDASNKD